MRNHSMCSRTTILCFAVGGFIGGVTNAVPARAASAISVAPAVRGDRQPSNTPRERHLRYKLIVVGTFGGPQSFFSANINDAGVATGVADTTTKDPFYPNANPLINSFGPDPYVYHGFVTKNGRKIDLGALPGANSSWPYWISSNGESAGGSINGTIDPLTGWPEENAVLWLDGQIFNLGTLGGYESSSFYVNSRGDAVGFAGNAISDSNSMFGLGTQTRAFLYRDGRMRDLGTLGGPDAFAVQVNERGQVMGPSYLNSAPSTNCSFFTLSTGTFFWEKGGMVDIGTLGGTCTNPAVYGMNERGQIVGSSNLAGNTVTHAFLWYPESKRLRDLGTPGGTLSIANRLNGNGDTVIGGGTTAGDAAFHGFVWKAGVLTDIGSVPGLDCSNAFDLNSSGQVVGQAFPCNTGPIAHAFLWENGHIIDLNRFVPRGSDVTLVDSENINDRGEIWGDAVLPNGVFRAFLLVPCEDARAKDCVEGVIRASGMSRDNRPPAQFRRNPALMNGWAAMRYRLGRRSYMPGFNLPNRQF